MKFGLFGGFRARQTNGEPVTLSSKKAQALIAYLVVESNRPHSREMLASLLWGNTGEERARHNLRQSLSRIRQTFGAILVADKNCVSLDPRACCSDVGEFCSLSGEAGRNELRRCLDLYEGDFLEGVERKPWPCSTNYSSWTRSMRTRIGS